MLPKGLTTTFTIKFSDEEIQLTHAEAIFVTFENTKTGIKIQKTGSDLEVSYNTIRTTLSQRETLRLGVGKLEIMVNWVLDGVRDASNIMTYELTKNLIEKEI